MGQAHAGTHDLGGALRGQVRHGLLLCGGCCSHTAVGEGAAWGGAWKRACTARSLVAERVDTTA